MDSPAQSAAVRRPEDDECRPALHIPDSFGACRADRTRVCPVLRHSPALAAPCRGWVFDSQAYVIIDYEDGSTASDIEADLCIIGAGAAGITVAHAFIGTAMRVCILESGGIDGERES